MDADYYIQRRDAGKMNTSHLIQRLKAPCAGCPVSPFSFGGGKLNGGLGKEALAALSGLFYFDYMGSSEFEWGAVPAALSRIACDRKDFVGGVAFIYPPEVRLPFNSLAPTTTSKVFVLAHRDEFDEVVLRIEQLARDEFKLHLKESCGLDRAICGDKYAARGWLELNNGFMFFVDREMYERTADMFDICGGALAPPRPVKRKVPKRKVSK